MLGICQYPCRQFENRKAGDRVTDRPRRKGYVRHAKVEWLGGTKIRFHMSCGHTNIKDMAKSFTKGHPANAQYYIEPDGSPSFSFQQKLRYWFGRRPGEKKIEVGDIGKSATVTTKCSRCLKLEEAGKPSITVPMRGNKIRWSDEPDVWHPTYTLPPRRVESVREQSRD